MCSRWVPDKLFGIEKISQKKFVEKEKVVTFAARLELKRQDL